MTTTTLTSREFNQDTSRAKKAARRGPVFITDRGRPALAQPGDADFEFKPPRLKGGIFKPADLG
jgi:hypothetical protein